MIGNERLEIGDRLFDLYTNSYLTVSEIRDSTFKCGDDWFGLNGTYHGRPRLFWHDPTLVNVPKDIVKYTQAKRILDFIIGEL